MNIYIPTATNSLEGKSFDARFINPGVGGTEYLSVILAWALSERFKHLNVKIISKCSFHLINKPDNLALINENVNNVWAATDWASSFWILTVSLAESLSIKIKENHYVNSVVWSHHPSDWRVLKFSKIHKSLVSTGLYQFHSNLFYFKKHHLVNNLYFPQFDNELINSNINEKKLKEFNVMFLGALIPAKGFHHVLENWKNIKSAIPNAILHVVGGSNLYGTEKNIDTQIPCDSDYAAKLKRIILKDSLDVNSIVFYGSCGEERFDIYKKMNVAIVNPTGVSESFSFNLHECIDFGIPVVASIDYGLNDVMKYFDNLSISSPSEIVNRIIQINSEKFSKEDFKLRRAKYLNMIKKRNDKILESWLKIINGQLMADKYRINSYVLLKGVVRSLVGRVKNLIKN